MHIDSNMAANAWGPMFLGIDAEPLTRQENSWRKHITDNTLSMIRAKKIHDTLDPNAPFKTREEFFKCIASLCCLYKDEVSKLVTGTSKPVRHVLLCACLPERAEWLMNNLRIRHSVPLGLSKLMPFGTTSNESLHAEINRTFKQTQTIHQATLHIKLRILLLAKIIAHDNALFKSTLRQVPSKIVLARSISCSPWNTTSWSSWCSGLRSNGVVRKADLPLNAERSSQVLAVRKWTCKRPACQQKTPKSNFKRTAFSRQRISKLRMQGKKVQLQ